MEEGVKLTSYICGGIIILTLIIMTSLSFVEGGNERARLQREANLIQEVQTEEKAFMNEKIGAEQEKTEILEQEKENNARDSDGDGLTYEEEMELGTSDNDSDSDSDGIPDGMDTHPAGGGRNIVIVHDWEHNGVPYTKTITFHEDWYDYYRKKPRKTFDGSMATYNDPTIRDIADYLKKIKEGLEEGCSSCIALDFVQSMPYVKDAYTSFDHYPKYPIETIVEENGDCEDTAYLTAAIIRAMGLGTVLLNPPKHMAVGVRCDWPGSDMVTYNGQTYCYIETTGNSWKVGEMPSGYEGEKINIYPVN